jgi:hypothetical protein
MIPVFNSILLRVSREYVRKKSDGLLLPNVVPCAPAGEVFLLEEVVLERNFVYRRGARTGLR